MMHFEHWTKLVRNEGSPPPRKGAGLYGTVQPLALALHNGSQQGEPDEAPRESVTTTHQTLLFLSLY